MPAVAARYYTPDDRNARKVDELADLERKERGDRLNTYWAYYEGNHHKPLVVEAGERDDNVILNLCGQAIDKSVAFFAPKPPVLHLEGETPQPGDESAEQKALDAFWEANDLDEFVVDLGLAGFVSGHPFVKLLRPERTGELPQAVVLDTRHVTVFWDVMNTRRALWYRLQWETEKNVEARRQDIVPQWLLTTVINEDGVEVVPDYDPESTWVVIEYQKTRATGGKWKETGRDEWPFPFAPIVHRKNQPMPHSFYGQSDLRHYALNDAVNFVASNTSRIIKFHAQPKTFITGANLGQINSTSIDGVWELPEGATVNNLEMSSDLASSMRMLETLRSAFFTQGRVVDWASQKDKVGQLTNFGLRVLFGDMLDLTRAKHKVYGGLLAEVSRDALIMMGHANASEPDAQWEDPLPKDRTEMVQSATSEKLLGFTSQRTLATDLGRDYDVEKKQRIDEVDVDAMLNEGAPVGVSG